MKFQRWMDFLGIPASVAAFLALYLMPLPSGLSLRGEAAIATFAAALVLWVTQAIPVYATSLLAMVTLIVTDAWDETNVYAMLGQDVIWIIVSAFILTSAMSKTHFARRIALTMVVSFGRRAKWALLSMALLNGALAFFVPSLTARAALLLPIVALLADVYGATPGKSNFGASLMMQEVQVNSIFTSGIMTATACNVMAVGFIRNLGGQEVFYSDWLCAAFPIAVLAALASWGIGLWLFKPEHDTPHGDGLNRLRGDLREMGPMTRDEGKAAFILGIAVFLWATDRWHVAWWGFTIGASTAAVIAAATCFLPGIGLLTWKEAKIPWDLMIFSAGAYAVGLAVEESGGARWLLDGMLVKSGIANMSFFGAYSLVIVISMFSHIVFTSKTVRTAIVIPMVISLAKSMGYKPVSLALPAAFTMAWTITLPPHSKPNLIFYSTGHFTVLQMLGYGILVCTVGVILLIAAGTTWFHFLGITP